MKLFDVYPLYPVEPVKARGAEVWDKNGKRYLDFYGGHGVISIGHSHPVYVEKLKDQIDKIGFYSNSVINGLQTELAQRLGALSGLNDYNLFLVNSGAEANENALKLASFHTGKREVIAFEKGFHGRTSAAVMATDNPKIQAPFNKGHKVHILPLNQLAAVEELMKTDKISSVIIEGIQGVGGLNQGNSSFFKALANLCKTYGVLLILDEIQSGYGRSGRFFAFQHHDIQPDIVTVAKGMGNGFPIGGLLINPEIKASYGLLGTTFGGNHLACAAAISVVDIIEQEQLMKHASAMSDYFKKSIEALNLEAELKGRGLMMGLRFDFPVAELRRKMVLDYGIFTGGSADANLLRILPPLNITKEEIDEFIAGLKSALN